MEHTTDGGIRIEVTDESIRATYGRMALPTAKALAAKVVEAPKGQRGALKARGANESFEAYQTRILERRAQLAADKRKARAKAIEAIKANVAESVNIGGLNPMVAYHRAMSENTVLPKRTSMATREDIALILTGRFASTGRVRNKVKGMSVSSKTIQGVEDYALLQTGYWRGEGGHGERMVCSRSNPLYRIQDLSASRVKFPHMEGFGRLGFEPSGTQGERMKTAEQRAPRYARGVAPSTYDERVWRNSYDRLINHHGGSSYNVHPLVSATPYIPPATFHAPTPFTTSTPETHGRMCVYCYLPANR